MFLFMLIIVNIGDCPSINYVLMFMLRLFSLVVMLMLL